MRLSSLSGIRLWSGLPTDPTCGIGSTVERKYHLHFYRRKRRRGLSCRELTLRQERSALWHNPVRRQLDQPPVSLLWSNWLRHSIRLKPTNCPWRRLDRNCPPLLYRREWRRSHSDSELGDRHKWNPLRHDQRRWCCRSRRRIRPKALGGADHRLST
jgi:hypothetical protein